MTSPGQLRGAESAGRYLNMLLQRPGPYRDQWARRAMLTRATNEVSRAAVARVLAEHLWELGERSDVSVGLPRELKDRVTRALTGEVLSPETLTWFVDAFRIADVDASYLWTLLLDQRRPPTVCGNLVPPRALARSLQEPRHFTLSLHDFHYVNRDGYSRQHHAVQTVRAAGNELHSIQHRFEATDISVAVGYGARAARIHYIGSSLCTVDVELRRPLQTGETIALEYDMSFQAKPSQRSRFRRVIFGRAENMGMTVTFDPDRRPRQIWRALWPRLAGRPSNFEEISLSDEASAHQYFDVVEKAIIGFVWEW